MINKMGARYAKSDLIGFGKEVKRIREEKGFSQNQLGRSLTVPLNADYIKRIELGYLMPGIKKCLEIAFILGIEIDFFHNLTLPIRLKNYENRLKKVYKGLIDGEC